ncbi:hypothetical protein FDW83_14150 [Pseudarthrobacter sp. NamE2]|uniref:hypothetical protein n=1 Tax=Pseudarthrobacter sp. NamE2 TaxID=2576838 RepID=UPI0010FDB7CA|nr:hypothetical protein [Pseudarthrobacter sp. NamE2]TLM81878.1 hypothetical protein FDW83_14150 [Pseudarthrobacter sp. NamE2]
MQQSPSSDSSGRDPVTRSDVRQTREEILEYWTRQRMAEAKPRELRLPAEGARLDQRDADTGDTGGGAAETSP